jgi:PIN domain nuclease of toxin-antitoxin system
MALVMGESAGDEVQELIHSATRSSQDLWMTTVNLGEVWYSVAREKSPAADEAVRLVALAGVRLAPADWALPYQAARYKSRYGLSYADAFAAALAHAQSVELLTGDPEFRALENAARWGRCSAGLNDVRSTQRQNWPLMNADKR